QLTNGRELQEMKIELGGNELHYAGDVYAVTFSPVVKLTGGKDHLKLNGTINIVDGRYTQNWGDPRGWVIQPRAVERSTPFGEGVPLVETLELNLRVEAPGGQLVFHDNLADMTGSAHLLVSNTLSDPSFEGQIQINPGGKVTLPLARVPFD